MDNELTSWSVIYFLSWEVTSLRQALGKEEAHSAQCPPPREYPGMAALWVMVLFSRLLSPVPGQLTLCQTKADVAAEWQALSPPYPAGYNLPGQPQLAELPVSTCPHQAVTATWNNGTTGCQMTQLLDDPLKSLPRR